MKPMPILLGLLLGLSIAMLLSMLRNNKRMEPEREFEPFDVGRLMVVDDMRVADTSRGLATDGVFIFFSPDCRFCDSSITFWRELAAAADARGISLCAISLGEREETLRYVHINGFFFSVFITPNPSEMRKEYKLPATPTVYRFSKGRAVARLVGAPTDDYNVLIHKLIGVAP